MNDCELWAGTTNPDGYGQVTVKIDGVWRSRGIHRELYQVEHGEIPKGLVIDHLCRNRNCINTKHMEVVTNHENVLRGVSGQQFSQRTHCPKGHEYTVENTNLLRNGKARECRICRQEWRRNYYLKYTR